MMMIIQTPPFPKQFPTALQACPCNYIIVNNTSILITILQSEVFQTETEEQTYGQKFESKLRVASSNVRMNVI